jgi:type IV fimbrial biogenesis protein FimT
LIAHLQYARLAAITRVTPVIACPSTDARECDGNRWDTGWIVFVDPDRNGRVDRDEELLRVVQNRERIRIHSGGRYRVRFQPTGGAYGSNLTLRVCPVRSEVDGRAVIVSNPGRVRMLRRLDSTECEF